MKTINFTDFKGYILIKFDDVKFNKNKTLLKFEKGEALINNTLLNPKYGEIKDTVFDVDEFIYNDDEIRYNFYYSFNNKKNFAISLKEDIPSLRGRFEERSFMYSIKENFEKIKDFLKNKEVNILNLVVDAPFNFDYIHNKKSIREDCFTIDFEFLNTYSFTALNVYKYENRIVFCMEDDVLPKFLIEECLQEDEVIDENHYFDYSVKFVYIKNEDEKFVPSDYTSKIFKKIENFVKNSDEDDYGSYKPTFLQDLIENNLDKIISNNNRKTLTIKIDIEKDVLKQGVSLYLDDDNVHGSVINNLKNKIEELNSLNEKLKEENEKLKEFKEKYNDEDDDTSKTDESKKDVLDNEKDLLPFERTRYINGIKFKPEDDTNKFIDIGPIVLFIQRNDWNENQFLVQLHTLYDFDQYKKDLHGYNDQPSEYCLDYNMIYDRTTKKFEGINLKELKENIIEKIEGAEPLYDGESFFNLLINKIDDILEGNDIKWYGKFKDSKWNECYDGVDYISDDYYDRAWPEENEKETWNDLPDFEDPYSPLYDQDYKINASEYEHFECYDSRSKYYHKLDYNNEIIPFNYSTPTSMDQECSDSKYIVENDENNNFIQLIFRRDFSDEYICDDDAGGDELHYDLNITIDTKYKSYLKDKEFIQKLYNEAKYEIYKEMSNRYESLAKHSKTSDSYNNWYNEDLVNPIILKPGKIFIKNLDKFEKYSDQIIIIKK